MVPVTLKMIVSPGEEMVILSRSDPDPLSDRLVTVRVAAVPSAGRSSSAKERPGQAPLHGERLQRGIGPMQER